MELLWSQFGLVTGVLCVLVLGAWYVARIITPAERSLIGGAALVVAGLFYVVRFGVEPDMAAVGMAVGITGIAMCVRQALRWRRTESSRAWPFAIVFLLPPAVLGALLLAGVVYTILAPTARAAGLGH